MFNNFRTLIASSLVSLVQLFSSPDVSAATCEAPVESNIEGVVICDLGVLKGGESSFARAVSDDGRIVVGVSGSSVGERAFMWTEEQGMVSLGVLPGGTESQARAISADGSTIVGKSGSEAGWRAFRWTKETGMVSLGEVDGHREIGATGVSADGTVVVGSAVGLGGRSAFRWTADSGITFIETEDLHRDSAALGVSGDGQVIVGRVGSRAFRWTASEGVVLLKSVQGEKLMYAHDASLDGSVIVGEAGSNSRSKVFYWHPMGKKQVLFSVAEFKKSGALAVNRLGTTLVGYVKGSGAQNAFIRKTDGSWKLLGRLSKTGGYLFSKASDVSSDSLTVVGTSTGEAGNRAVIWKLTRQD